MTKFIQKHESCDFDYPKEFVSGNTDRCRFYDYTNKEEYFAECVGRNIIRNERLNFGYEAALMRSRVVDVDYCTQIIIEVHAKGQRTNGSWVPCLREVLYMVGKGTNPRMYRVYE